jgi:hypothetical protein
MSRCIGAILIVFACSPAMAALAVSVMSGAWNWEYYSSTGNGNGFPLGGFEINNPDAIALSVSSITLTATGTGDDSSAFSEVGLFIDSNDNGIYDPGVDTRYGTPASAYPVDDGSLTFNQNSGIASGATVRFLVVAKFGGPVPPAQPEGFQAFVSAISATGGAPSGIPTGNVPGVAALGQSTPLRLEYNVTGTAPPYSYTFRLILDNHDNSWIAGQSWRGTIFGQAPFGFGGTTPFLTWSTNGASYPIGPYNDTYWSTFGVVGVPHDGPVLFNTSGSQSWMPVGVGDQLVWWGTSDVLLDDGEMAWSIQYSTSGAPSSALLEPAHRVGPFSRVEAVPGAAVSAVSTETGGGDGFAIGAFTVTSHDSAGTLSSITIAAGGTGDDSAAFSEIGLFHDTNANGAFDPGVDQRFGQAYSGYPSDDGTLTFTDSLAFQDAHTDTFLIVAKLNGSVLATPGQTFNTTVVSINASGGPHSGLPTASIPGIIINAPALSVERGAATIANGGIDALGAASTATYTIRNTGTAVLDLTGSPLVQLTPGANVGSVAVVTPPAASVAPGGSTTFELSFTPVTPGAWDFQVSVASNDAANNPCTWTVSGSTPSPGGNGSGSQSDSGGCAAATAGPAWALLLLLFTAACLHRRRATATGDALVEAEGGSTTAASGTGGNATATCTGAGTASAIGGACTGTTASHGGDAEAYATANGGTASAVAGDGKVGGQAGAFADLDALAEGGDGVGASSTGGYAYAETAAGGTSFATAIGGDGTTPGLADAMGPTGQFSHTPAGGTSGEIEVWN